MVYDNRSPKNMQHYIIFIFSFLQNAKQHAGRARIFSSLQYDSDKLPD